jgi:uncharacterized protein (TIGR02452 family)
MRSTRAELARQTVEFVERGSYLAGEDRVVDITDQVRTCLETTRFFTPEELEKLRDATLSRTATRLPTVFEVVNETTLSGIARLSAAGQRSVAALNFASAKNPGGGFLNGSQAQEESLARSSALYASLMRAMKFYERHRTSASLLYTDAMILSSDCPVIRDDHGTLLDEPHTVTFITSAAPNAGAIAQNQPKDQSKIPSVLRRRAELVLTLAASQGYTHLVLGAWGCGVFRNDPALVASVFAEHLLQGAWTGRFEHVVFSVLDSSAEQKTFESFARLFA